MTQTEFEHKLIEMRPQMMRVAMDFFHNEEDAMDIVQEVYVQTLFVSSIYITLKTIKCQV